VREFQRGHGDFDHNGRNGHFAEKGNFDHHGHGHRVFRNGAWVWVWVYGPDYYSGDCGWLLNRARVTGSPYWWSSTTQRRLLLRLGPEVSGSEAPGVTASAGASS